MTGNPLKRLSSFGQSPWLDYIHRRLLENGELERMIEEWDLRGMTSNPTIFDQAIAEADYEDEIARLAASGRAAAGIYDEIVLADVRAAADRFEPVYRRTDGLDGYVSLEVSPHLARDTEGTIAEGRRLFAALDRPNVMIKVPGTVEGLPAIRTLTAEGININVTLLFSVERYGAVLDSYLAGLEDALERGRSIDGIASVASFFLSRIDSTVDKRLDAIAADEGAAAGEAAAVRGEAAIACAHSAYAVLEQTLATDRWARLAARGARVQRLLWASTGAKDPAYSATKYVDPLVGAHTVNTMPLETLETYARDGRPHQTLPGDTAHANEVFDTLARLGIDLGAVTDELVEEGIDKFVRPYDASLERLTAHEQVAVRG